jgi:hypothetical protein
MSDVSARDALEHKIIEAIRAAEFTYSELATVMVRVHRLAKAKPQYGGLDLATDKRDLELERSLEEVDAIWYRDAKYVYDTDPAFAFIRELRQAERVREFRDRMRCEEADANFVRVDVALDELVESTFDVRDGKTLEIIPPGAEMLP